MAKRVGSNGLAKPFGLALIVAAVFAAFASASASASPIWYQCEYVGPGAKSAKYSNANCNDESGVKAYAWKALTGSTTAKMTNTTSFTLTFKDQPGGGAQIDIECSSMTGESTIENSLGTGTWAPSFLEEGRTSNSADANR